MANNLDYFKLTRDFWDFSFENPELIKPNHCALYLFIVEHCNRLGWKEKFGLPTEMAKDAIGIKSYNTYISTLTNLVDWGFLKMVEKSKNQYSSNIVALLKFNKASDKALDKASIKHITKQSESTVQSIDSIDKHNTNIHITNLQIYNSLLLDEYWINEISEKNKISNDLSKKYLLEFDKKLKTEKDNKTSIQEYASHFSRWIKIEIKKTKDNQNGKPTSTTKPTFRNSFQTAFNISKQTEASNPERELSEDTEFTVVE